MQRWNSIGWQFYNFLKTPKALNSRSRLNALRQILESFGITLDTDQFPNRFIDEISSSEVYDERPVWVSDGKCKCKTDSIELKNWYKKEGGKKLHPVTRLAVTSTDTDIETYNEIENFLRELEKVAKKLYDLTQEIQNLTTEQTELSGDTDLLLENEKLLNDLLTITLLKYTAEVKSEIEGIFEKYAKRVEETITESTSTPVISDEQDTSKTEENNSDIATSQGNIRATSCCATTFYAPAEVRDLQTSVTTRIENSETIKPKLNCGKK